jgi:hypothetical protein
MSETAFEQTERNRARALEVAGPECIAEDFGGEVVVLNGATGVYYSLTDLAAGVWRDLMAGHSVESLLSAISRADERASQATIDFIDSLEEAGLLRQSDPRAPSTAAPESVALVSAGETKLTIQSFEDLSELILADPIHDVDGEFGWPILRREDQ